MFSKAKALGAIGTVAATIALGGAATSVANNENAYCGHGITYAGEHNSVVYEASRTWSGQHQHQYKHDVSNWVDHHPWKNC